MGRHVLVAFIQQRIHGVSAHAVLALLVQVRNRAPFQVIGDIQLADAHLAGLLQVLVSGTGAPMQYQRNRNLFPTSVSFMMQKMTIDADDARFDEIMKEVVEVCKKVEPDCIINM